MNPFEDCLAQTAKLRGLAKMFSWKGAILRAECKVRNAPLRWQIGGEALIARALVEPVPLPSVQRQRLTLAKIEMDKNGTRVARFHRLYESFIKVHPAMTTILDGWAEDAKKKKKAKAAKKKAKQAKKKAKKKATSHDDDGDDEDEDHEEEVEEDNEEEEDGVNFTPEEFEAVLETEACMHVTAFLTTISQYESKITNPFYPMICRWVMEQAYD